ncbi:hypothetical protein RZO55_16385 [Clostridium boliviensis]|uniref:Uncharacterized protein n=1 Tax=Clostridium boliviensis TaxID=318465 RepID=A0ABU4GSI8_9CLOT|nr:hypothetical protein [Clostridium boliviensis]MDW2799152.1 hypothetical protein [Clostridium boliviensis]
MEYENTWVLFGDGGAVARKSIEAEHHYISLQIQTHGDGTFTLVIEAGIEAISVELRSKTLEEALQEADGFSRDYFRDKARLFDEISDRI